MGKSPIEIAIGQTNILVEDEVCKAVGRVGIHINKEGLLKALKAYEFVEELTNYIFEYPDDDYMTMECLCRKLVKHGLLDKVDGYYQTHEIRTNTHECVKDTHDKTEPTISKMEQVETMSCAECKHRPIGAEICEEPCHYEPQTDWHYDEQDATWYPYKHEDEPQTERSGDENA